MIKNKKDILLYISMGSQSPLFKEKGIEVFLDLAK